MSRAFTITDTSVNLVIDGKVFNIPRESVNGRKVMEAIRDNVSDAELLDLADPTTYINAVGGGLVTIKCGEVRYNGEAIPECISERLLDMLSNNIPVSHLVNFYARLDKNPSRRAVQELYKFLEHKNIPITADGKLLMYKAVNNDWKDKHTRTFSNHIGAVLEMPRRKVCDDANIGCSVGWHAGSLEYVRGFACGYGTEGGDRILIVEVDPADVVSIPHDCACQKLRTCKYTVLQEFKGELPVGGVRDTSNPYGEDDDDDEGVEYCDNCGAVLENDGTCESCDGDEEVVMTQSELDAIIERERKNAVEDARETIEEEVKAEIRDRI